MEKITLTDYEEWALKFITENEKNLKFCDYYFDSDGIISIDLLNTDVSLGEKRDKFSVKFCGANYIKFTFNNEPIDRKIIRKFFNNCSNLIKKNNTDLLGISKLQNSYLIREKVFLNESPDIMSEKITYSEKIFSEDQGNIEYFLCVSCFINKEILINFENLLKVKNGELNLENKKIFDKFYFNAYKIDKAKKNKRYIDFGNHEIAALIEILGVFEL